MAQEIDHRLYHKRHLNRAILLIKSFFLISWILIGSYVMFEISPMAINNCPSSEGELFYKGFVLIFGTFAWIRLILYDRYLYLIIHGMILIYLIGHVMSMIQRYHTFNLSNDEISFYSLFHNKMFAVGLCQITMKVSLGLYHVAILFTLIIITIHFGILLIRRLSRWERTLLIQDNGSFP